MNELNKGIVMEMTQAHLVVLTPDGRFLKIPRSSRLCEVGDEIVFTIPLFRWKRPFLTFTSSVAAAVVLCIVAFTGITPHLGGVQPIVAYVTLDINPSVELGIDSREQVQEVRGLNDDGIVLIEQLNYKGKSLNAVTNELLDRVEQKGLLAAGEGDIIISSTKAFEEAKIDDTAVSESVKKSVDKHILEKHPNNQSGIHVASLVASLEIRQAALSEGVSAGKYAIYLNAKSIGSSVTIEEIKTQSIHTIAQERGGIDKLIDTKKIPQKETLSRLLEEEKNGELDAKLKEQQDQKSKDDKKNDDKKSNNNNNNNKATPTPDKKQDNSKTGNNSTPTPTPKKTNNPAAPVSLERDKKAKEEEDKKREEEQKRQEDARKKLEEERKQQAEEKAKADDRKKQDDDRKKLEEDKRKQDEERKKQEEEKRKQEDAKKKQEDEKAGRRPEERR